MPTASSPPADGRLLIAQNSNSAVLELDKNGKETVVFRDTNTGGALSMSKSGALFIVQRGLYPSIWQLRPQRKLLADKFKGDPLDCLRTVINDLSADSHGGVYFTDGGLFHADAQGSIAQYGEDLTTNGIILSGDEKTLYVTNRESVVAFDVQPRRVAHSPTRVWQAAGFRRRDDYRRRRAASTSPHTVRKTASTSSPSRVSC